MSVKVTACAPSNIAFIKYWGARDLSRALPVNPSLSMTLRTSYARTTAAEIDGKSDVIELAAPDGTLTRAPDGFAARAGRHLEHLREWTGRRAALRIATINSFPSDAGLASSAAGFCALAFAASHALGHTPSAAELSRLARLSGSGSAARSAMGGFVLWPSTDDDESPAVAVAPPDHWPLENVIAVVDTEAKKVSSRDGHRRAATSPHFETRLANLPDRLARVQRAIQERDLATLGPLIEEEAIELHLIAMSSSPAIFYWTPATLAVLDRVRSLRETGLQAYATMDAGPNVHVLCEADDAERVAAALEAVPGTERVLRDGMGTGPVLVDRHLF